MMSILAENIKLYNPFRNRFLFIQGLCQIMWPIFLISSFSKNGIIKVLEANQYPISYILWFILSVYSLGVMVTLIQVDILTKPLSVCLPNQHKTTVTIIILFGSITNLFYCAIFFILPHPSGIMGILYFITILFMGFSLFIIGAFITFYIQIKREYFQFIYIFSILILIVISILGSVKLFVLPLDSFLFTISAPSLVLVIALIDALNKKILHSDFKRMLALKDFSLPDLSNLRNTIKLTDSYILKRLSDSVEDETVADSIFFRLINNFPYLNLKRCVTTGIYCIVDRYHTLNEGRFKTVLFLIFSVTSFLLLLTGYLSSFTDMGNAVTKNDFYPIAAAIYCILIPIFIIPSVMVTSEFHPVNHNHLLPKGRLRHFYSSILIWLVKPVTVVLWISFTIFIAQVIKYIMPDLTISGVEFQYSAPSFSFLFWSLLVVPVFDLFMYYFEKPCSLLTMILFMIILMGLSLLSIFTINPTHHYIAMALAFVLSYGFFIERLWRYWFKKDIELME